jgi:uncharacterized UPF0160 family protein
MKNPSIGTHNGSFHADEVFACALLSSLYPEATITRTRDKAVLETLDIIVDVEGEFDPSRGRFDHHQKGGAGERDGVPFSSFGLVWEAYGLQLCGNQLVADRVYETLVRAIDANDNGMRTTAHVEGKPLVREASLASIIGSFNSSWKDEGSDNDPNFAEAMAFAKSHLQRVVANAQSWLDAREIVSSGAIVKDKILVLDRYAPWAEHLTSMRSMDEILFVVFPTKKGDWNVQAAPKGDLGSFQSRALLPESWVIPGFGEEQRQGLALASGIPDVVFVHQGRWIGGTKSRDTAIQMAVKAVSSV